MPIFTFSPLREALSQYFFHEAQFVRSEGIELSRVH